MLIYTFLEKAPPPRNVVTKPAATAEVEADARVEKAVREKAALERILHAVLDSLMRFPEALEVATQTMGIVYLELQQQPGVP